MRRYCRCGTRLARDHTGELCSPCARGLAALPLAPPSVPPGFWDTDEFRQAFAAQHIGMVSRAYRKHPHHVAAYGRAGIPQEVVGGWLGLTQAQISRIENGPPVRNLDSLTHWVRTLAIPQELLWFTCAPPSGVPPTHRPRQSAPVPHDLTAAGSRAPDVPEIDEMNRRELLRLVTVAGALLTTPDGDDDQPGRNHPDGRPPPGAGWLDTERFDWERLDHAGRTGRVDATTVDQYALFNAELWQTFTAATTKEAVFPLVRAHLDVLVAGLRRSPGLHLHRRLCALTADLLQLAGEILFDRRLYTDAAQCYALAASASKEAGAFDLWACALVRHAFIGIYERQFAVAVPMLDLAHRVARRGDSGLSTRYWVAAVQAEAFAGLGERRGCEAALARSEEVRGLRGTIHTGGWLRFDGSRLPDERGACYVELERPDQAESALRAALADELSPRRRGCVLADLAMTGVQRRDPQQVVTYADAALDTVRRTRSGVIHQKLQRLQARIGPFVRDRRVRRVRDDITALTRYPAAG